MSLQIATASRDTQVSKLGSQFQCRLCKKNRCASRIKMIQLVGTSEVVLYNWEWTQNDERYCGGDSPTAETRNQAAAARAEFAKSLFFCFRVACVRQAALDNMINGFPSTGRFSFRCDAMISLRGLQLSRSIRMR